MAWTERYVRTDAAGGGDGTTNTNSGSNGAWTLAEAIAAAATELAAISPNSLRMNVKSGTYSLSGAITISGAGLATTPIWWRGFDSTIGDLDTETDHTLFPWFDFSGTSSFLTVSATFNWISNVRVTAANTSASSAAVAWTGADGRIVHCHIVGEAADTDGHALTISGTADRTLIYCNYLASLINAVATLEVSTGADASICLGNYITGGAIGASLGSRVTFTNNIVENVTTGVSIGTSAVTIIGNSIHNTTGAGVSVNSGNNAITVINNIFSEIGTYAITHAVADHATMLIANNAYWDVTSGQLENVPEQLGAITCAASPFVNAAGGDFTPTTEVQALGFPSRVGLASTLTYIDVGAVQKQASGSGGGLMRHPGMSGGMNG